MKRVLHHFGDVGVVRCEVSSENCETFQLLISLASPRSSSLRTESQT